MLHRWDMAQRWHNREHANPCSRCFKLIKIHVVGNELEQIIHKRHKGKTELNLELYTKFAFNHIQLSTLSILAFF